jgi:hypothetical protein
VTAKTVLLWFCCCFLIVERGASQSDKRERWFCWSELLQCSRVIFWPSLRYCSWHTIQVIMFMKESFFSFSHFWGRKVQTVQTLVLSLEPSGIDILTSVGIGIWSKRRDRFGIGIEYSIGIFRGLWFCQFSHSVDISYPELLFHWQFLCCLQLSLHILRTCGVSCELHSPIKDS